MTQKDKELLLKDLIGRLPYGVLLWNSLDARCGKKPFKLSKINHKKRKAYVQEEEGGPIVLDEYGGWKMNDKYSLSDFTKPYLRPMSSMTEEELKELNEKYGNIAYFFIQEPPYYHGLQAQHSDIGSIEISEFSEIYDWLNAHHFDYRGLIPMGLALEASEGMYKTE